MTQTNKNTSVWEKTSVQNLWRHKSGVYYARYWVSGRDKWKSLKTRSLSTARLKLSGVQGKAEELRRNNRRGNSDKLTFGDAVKVVLDRRQSDPRRKDSTKAYDLRCWTKIKQVWPQLENLRLDGISKEDCEGFGKKLRNAPRFMPPGAKKPRIGKGISSNYHNVIRDFLVEVFEVGIDRAFISRNPARSIPRMPSKPKLLELPNHEQFSKICEVIKTASGRFSRSAWELVSFLTFTGARKNEAAHVKWSDIDWNRNLLLLSETKNGERRYIPFNDDLKNLLRDIKSKRDEIVPEESVLIIQECQKALNRACKIAGCKRLTHHDLRHYFATTCIESGMDIPTVARLMGHKDGGALAMRVYGHLRQDHARDAFHNVHFTA